MALLPAGLQMFCCRTEPVFFMNKLKQSVIQLHNTILISRARKKIQINRFTLISQNCIGGVFYHDMGLQFQSPTINLFFVAEDFLKFVEHLEYYLSIKIQVIPGDAYPIGILGDITIHFLHYHTCADAEEAWIKRTKRVLLDKIVVCATDRDGFTDDIFVRWKQLPYPKVLFTANAAYGAERDSVYYEKYDSLESVPDLIPKREFYKDDILLRTVNRLG